ncbi:MAG TPA: hypothetical protein VGM91_20795 [Conexibacter sp.]|jgi:hypothetical protein
MRRTTLALIVTASTIFTALAATALPAQAAQRIDMRVLLLGATGTEPTFQAWQAQLQREGVPFDAVVARPGHTPITAQSLSTTLPDGTQEARYQAVIVATGGLLTCDATPCVSALSAGEWAALQTFEATFHVRQLTAYAFPGPDFGLNAPTVSGPLDNQTGTVTTTGQQVFPYLAGPVQIAAGTYGYQATPVAGAPFNTLVSGPGGSSLVGVFTHPDGREEMVQTFDGNQFQSQSWLLRHGQLAWVTRGTYIGDQRNYLELHIDDVFLGDDIWDPATHTTNYDETAAVRMTPDDVAAAVAWEQRSGLRFDMVYNGGGSVAQQQANAGADPLLDALTAQRAAFGWVNHTYDHPNVDCSTRAFIRKEITDNVAWAQSHGFPVNPAELVTGEHSGLANLVPGNPGTIDPPSLDDATAAGGGTLPAGNYDYSVTATSANGESIGSTTAVTVGANGSALLSWDAICHATTYRVYRSNAGANAWSLVGTVPQPADAFRDPGPVVMSYTDTGATNSPGAPPATNTALISPYGENPNFQGALADAGVTSTASDASKPYPVTPTSTTGAMYPAGASFTEGGFRAVPRYPTNVYYNVATQAQLLDEYNYLYNAPPAGVCVNSAVTTCQTASSTWAQIVQAESDRIFGHVMGNDPRPHYFHQTNIAETRVADGGVLYPVLDAVVADYRRYFAANAPIQQLSQSAVADLLARQNAWAAGSRQVTGYIEGNQVTLVNAAGAISAPLSGTEVGEMYGGMRSGWTSLPTGLSTHTAALAWPGTVVPPPVVPPAPPVTQPVAHDRTPGGPGPVIVPPEGQQGRTPAELRRAARRAAKKKAKARKLAAKKKIAQCVKRHGVSRAAKDPRSKRHAAAVRRVCRIKYARALKPVRRHQTSARESHRAK